MSCKHETDYQIAVRTSVVSILINLVLSFGKLAAGIVGASVAMISDAIHSASDVFSSIIVIIGIKIASKESDKDHPYGHERFEPVAAIILAFILFETGLAVGYKGVQTLISGEWRTYQAPGMAAVWAAVVSIAVKEGMYWYTIIRAKKINSSALKADAWHHRSDGFSSVGALIGILFARFGHLYMDSVASLVICAFIAKAAYDIFKDAIGKLVDRSCGPEFDSELVKHIETIEGVCHVDSISSRTFGNRVYVDVEFAADGSMTLTDAHEIAERVHESIESNFPVIKHITVHVNPWEGDTNK